MGEQFGESPDSLLIAFAQSPADDRALALLVEAIRQHGPERFVQRARQFAPEDAAIHTALGRALLASGNFQAAWECFLEVVSIDRDSADAHNNLGVAFSERGRHGEAENCFREALVLAPESATARLNLGRELKVQGRLTDAIECFRRAIQAGPENALAHHELAAALAEEGRTGEALEQFDRTIALDPSDIAVRWRRCFDRFPVVYSTPDEIAATRLAYAEDLLELDRATSPPSALQPDKIEKIVGLSQPFYLAYQGENDRDLQDRYGRMVARLMDSWRAASRLEYSPRRREAGGRIRLGIVSAHVRYHPVWQAIAKGIVNGLPGSRFELHAYHTGAIRDHETEAIAARFARFVQGPLSLRAWVDEIARDRPDALLYPEIGMDPMTIRLAGLRLAPVQMTAWGHPDTSGLPTMDAFLSAELLEPPGAQAHYTERLIRLPSLGCCFEPATTRAASVSLRSMGIPGDGAIRFVCCHTVYKYLPQYDEVFPRIAAGAGKCRFIFFADAIAHRNEILRSRLSQAFSRHGLRADDYCVFVSRLELPGFLGLLREMDVYLDAIGFSGFNTAMYALESGVPVVTLEGRTLRGRLASAILRRIGAADTVAAGVDDYVKLAVALAGDARMRKTLKRKIAAGLPKIYRDNAPMEALARVLESAVNGEWPEPAGAAI